MERMNVIKVVVTPQQPIEVKTQVKTTQVQIGTDAALGAVTQGVIDLHKKVDDLANKQVEVDLSPIAKEDTLAQGISSVESKVEEESQAIQGKIDNIDLTPIENKVDEGVNTLSTKIDNIKLPEVDLSGVAKQGENIHATNTAIYESLKNSSGYIKMTNSEYDEFKAHVQEITNNILN